MPRREKQRAQSAAWCCDPGFTLVELLVSCTVLVLLMALMLSLISQTSALWRRSSARIEAFQSARRGFDNLTGLLEQATLNTYWDYDDPNNPTRYRRQSELHFRVGPAGASSLPGATGTGEAVFFQAPANRTSDAASYGGLGGLLNACGFFIQYGSDAAWLPAHVNPSQARERFRLMQWMQDTEQLEVYEKAGSAWIPSPTKTEELPGAVPVADNVVALVIWPKEEGAPANPILNSYSYDSRWKSYNAPWESRESASHQLPPILQVALVAIDEASALRLGSSLKSTVDGCLAGLFEKPPKDNFSDDIKTLEGRLTAKAITVRSFVSAVPMREAKWSP
jgi:uncharacterized protein (TIGR02599 family)